jgi:hypothetical protein
MARCRLCLRCSEYLELPRDFNPRTAQLAAELRRDPRYTTASTPALVDAVLERLRTGGYTYTLEPGVFGTHTADEFWFDRKEGFCEHIASSFVLLMRAWACRRALLPATRVAKSTAWTAIGPCAKAMPMPGPRSGSPARAGFASTPPRPWPRGAPAANLRLEPPTVRDRAGTERVSPALHLNLRACGRPPTTAGTSGC